MSISRVIDMGVNSTFIIIIIEKYNVSEIFIISQTHRFSYNNINKKNKKK